MAKSQKRAAVIAALIAVAAGVALAAYFMLTTEAPAPPAQPTPARELPLPPGSSKIAIKDVEIGIAYSPDKQRWLQWAARQFSTTPEGKDIRVNLLAMDGAAAALALAAQDQRLHVWAPANTLQAQPVIRRWNEQRRTILVHEQQPLVYSPLAVVMWNERYDALAKAFGAADLNAIDRALQTSGWGECGGLPEWGLFKFAMPGKSSSDINNLCRAVVAYQAVDECERLTTELAGAPEIAARLQRAAAVAQNSTTLLRNMAMKGPEAYDAVIVDEKAAIDLLRGGGSRRGMLRAFYPGLNLWNDHPYYVLNVSWSRDKHRAAAAAFMEFLLSGIAQREAVNHGFRPAGLNVPIHYEGSPFVALSSQGIRADLPARCAPPAPEVMAALAGH